MTESIVTLWSDVSLEAAVTSARTGAILTACKPQGVQLHARASTLASEGERSTRYVRARWPAVEVLWAIAGDWLVPNDPGPVPGWADAGRAAQAAGVPRLQLNCESAWLDKPEVAAVAVRDLAAQVPGLELTFTSYGAPLEHLALPWQAFLARWRGVPTPIRESAFQTYFASQSHKADRAYSERWVSTYQGDIALAYGRGIISPRVARAVYLQAYWAPCTGLCEAAAGAERVYWWTAPLHADTEGLWAVASLAELYRRDRTVAEFQQEAGLVVDGLVGPKTRAALGVPVVMP